MTEDTRSPATRMSCSGGPGSRLLLPTVTQPGQQKLDHLVETRARLIGALHDETGMAEANHRHMSAPGGHIDIVDRKLPFRNAIGDDAPVDFVDALDMAGDYLPALGHGT